MRRGVHVERPCSTASAQTLSPVLGSLRSQGTTEEDSMFKTACRCDGNSLPSPRESRGRRESRVRAAPAVSRARVCKETHTSIQVQRRQSGLPCAMVLTVSFALSPVTGFLATVACGCCHKLDASVG